MRPLFDREGFADAVTDWLEREGVSYREAAARHDRLNPAMLSRAIRCHQLSVESLLAICAVSGIDPLRFIEFAERKQPVTAIDKRGTPLSGGAA
jgi:transposase-like protein